MSSRLSDPCMQVKDEGYEVEHNGYCVTVFSAPNYCDQMNNKGAWIRFSGKDMTPQFTQFEAVPHPKCPRNGLCRQLLQQHARHVIAGPFS